MRGAPQNHEKSGPFRDLRIELGLDCNTQIHDHIFVFAKGIYAFNLHLCMY